MAAKRSFPVAWCALLFVMSSGCAAWVPAPHVAAPLEQPFDRSTIVTFDSSATTRRTQIMPLTDYETQLVGPPKPERARPAAPRIHPLLVDWLRDSSKTKRIEAILTYADPIEIPRFPEPRVDQQRNSPANLAALAQAESLVKAVIGARAATYASDSTELAQQDGAQLLRTFWIIRAMKVRIELGRIKPLLARRDDLTYIAPNESGEPPPMTCAVDGAVSPARARELMNANFLWGHEDYLPWMSLLDCGVDTTHRAFHESGSTDTPRLGRVGDCRQPGCEGGDPEDGSCDGHGTESAAILASLPFPEACWEGMVRVKNGLDVFRVFDRDDPCPSDGKLNRDAVIEAFQQSVPKLDRVIVCETQAYGMDGSDIAGTADQAYNAGAAVVGAQGNCTGSATPGNSTVTDPNPRSPGNARRAIAAGGYNAADPRMTAPCLTADQCVGPTAGGRIKPEVLGPSHTFVASLGSGFGNLGGTSGATPYVASALALLRAQLAEPGAPVDPGQLYAALIACGEETWVETVEAPGSCQGSLAGIPVFDIDGFHPARGAGKFFLPGEGCQVRVDKLQVGSNTRVTLKIDLGEFRASRLDVALWWPDRVGVDRSDLVRRLVELWSRLFPGRPQPVWTAMLPAVEMSPRLRTLLSALSTRFQRFESDIDLEIASPSNGAIEWTAHSTSKRSVFERASVRAKGDRLDAGVWEVRVLGERVPDLIPSAPQTVYCTIIARP